MSTWRHRLRECSDALGGLCGEKICFSPPPPPFNLTGGRQWKAYRDTGWMEEYADMGITEMDWFCHAFIDSCYLCGSSHTLAEPSEIHAICEISHSRVPLLILSPYSYILSWVRTSPSHVFPSDAMRAPPLDHTVIIWTLRCAWRSWSCEIVEEYGGRDRASVEMHLQAETERVWRCTWRPCSCEIGGVFGNG